MNIRNYITSLLVCLALSGCGTPINNRKVDSSAIPVRDLTIGIAMGRLSPKAFPSEQDAYATQYRSSLETRFPDIFRKNGVPVDAVLIRAEGVVEGALLKQYMDFPKTSHLLILNAKSTQYFADKLTGQKQNDFSFVIYDAKLWDLKSRRLVWEASPRMRVDGSHPQPLTSTQSMAAGLLKGMNADGLISLKQDEPMDLSGQAISGKWIWEDDK